MRHNIVQLLCHIYHEAVVVEYAISSHTKNNVGSAIQVLVLMNIHYI